MKIAESCLDFDCSEAIQRKAHCLKKAKSQEQIVLTSRIDYAEESDASIDEELWAGT